MQKRANQKKKITSMDTDNIDSKTNKNKKNTNKQQ